MDVSLAVLADAANVSREGKLNILGAFDTIHATKFPTTHPSMQLVIRFVAYPSERLTPRKVTIKLLDADANELLTLSGDAVVPDKTGPDDINMVSIIGFSNVEFQQAGRYEFSILLNNDVKRTVPLKVVQREQSQPAT